MKVAGIVERGSGRGRSEFVPTLNLMLEEVPEDLAYGIYVCKVVIDGSEYGGAMHYGKRTTIDDLVTFEVNVFDFDQTIYGERVEVEVLEKIRDIVKFENKEELQKRIQEDIVKAKEILNKSR
jgi:riboflavin kinase/FMN adenylyltransferase